MSFKNVDKLMLSIIEKRSKDIGKRYIALEKQANQIKVYTEEAKSRPMSKLELELGIAAINSYEEELHAIDKEIKDLKVIYSSLGI